MTSEPETEQWIRDHLRKGDVFYDVGAGIGEFSLLVARQGGRVVAFEPMAASYLALVNASRTLEASILPLPIALGATLGMQTLHLTDTEAGGSGHTMGRAMENVRFVGYQHVICAPLDWVVTFFRLVPPTMLKIDVDGVEDHVLQGAAQTLTGVQLNHIMVEVNGIQQQQVVDRLLGNAGFSPGERYEVASQAWNCFYER